MRGNCWVEKATGRCVEASPASMGKRFGGSFVGEDGNAVSTAEWLWLPDLSAVEGVERRFWKVVADQVVPWTQAEIDAQLAEDAANAEPTVEELLARIAVLEGA